MAQPPPPGAPLPTGLLLGGRHQLGHALPRPPGARSTVWRSADTTLARPVAVRTWDDDPATGATGEASRSAARERFVAAAVQGGRATHPRLASVLDAAVQPAAAGGPPVAYAVVRWIDGLPLSQVLARGPLAPDRAARLVADACAAVSALHQAGVPHGRLHPGNVLLGVADEVTLTDAVLASTLHGDPDPELDDDPDQVAADTRALGWVLHAALTATWPGPASWAPELPATPRDGTGRPAAPRSVRAGVPRALDAVVARATDPGRRAGEAPLRTPVALAASLQPHALADAGPVEERRRRRPAGWRPRRPTRPLTRWALRLAAVVVVALVGWLAGYQIGKVPQTADARRALPPLPSSSASARSSAAAPLDLSTVTDFDPPPGDGEEHPAEVRLATDDDLATAWHTDRYSGDARLGGRKPGVGLLVDTGAEVAVSAVRLSLPGGGTDLELRAAPVGTVSAPTTAAAFRVVASQTGAQGDDVELRPSAPVTARFWLVWLTRLPPVSGGFQGAVAELAFLP